MKKITTFLLTGIIILFTTSFAKAQIAHVSVGTGIEKPIDKIHIGLNLNEDISAIWGYDSNGNTSDYFSTGLEMTRDIKDSRLFYNVNLRTVIGENHQKDEYGRSEGLDIGLAYDFNVGIVAEDNFMVGTGISHFVTKNDNISYNPIFVKLTF